MGNKREHGERNKELSNTLLEGKIYYDWSVTTAFYSAIHFVEDKILPCEINGTHCKNINDVKQAYKMKGRHASREKLVHNNLTLLTSIKYKWLDDKSRYSGYTTYKITITEAQKAKDFLKAIYEECYS